MTPSHPNPQSPSRAGFWRELRETLAGAERDWTQVPPRRAVALLAVPMMLEMVLESVFGVVDVFWVSRLGPAAVATVGLTEAVITVVFAVALGIAIATTALVARRIGEHDREAAAAAAGQALLLGAVVGVLIGVAGGLAAPRVLAAMGAGPEVLAVGVPYTRILLFAVPSIVLLFVGNAIFRGAGDPMIAIRVLWTANLINLVLDSCLIFGWGPFPELGLTGAAVATTIGRTAGVVVLVGALIRGRGRVRLTLRHLAPDRALLANLLRVSRGGVFQYLAETGAWVVLVRVIALFGEVALAGYTVAVRIILFSFLPAWGLSNAAATLVGQNLGAGRPDEAERSVWLTARYNVVFLGSVGLVFLAIPRALLAPFTDDPAVIAVGAECLRWLGASYGFFAVGLVAMQSFNGAGDTGTPTRLKILFYWILQLPIAWLLAVAAGLGPRGVFMTLAGTEVLLSLAAVWLFRKGRWKEMEV